MNYFQQLFSQSPRLAATSAEVRSALSEAIGLVTPTAFLFDDPKSYKEQVNDELQKLKEKIKATSELKNINLCDDFTTEDIPAGSIAYHRIWGFITSSSWYRFSTKRFEQDLLEAEANPNISCHFIHCNSGGGEAWYLDRLSETMRSLTKPIMVLCEQYNCSACYYITCHADFLAANTANDTIGCIGTMIEAFNEDGMYEKWGLKLVRAKATKSDLKNKMVEDLLEGHPEQYIHEVLDPMTEQFLNEVKTSRPALATLPEDDPVFRGATFDTAHAIENHLIDAKMSFPEALLKAQELADGYDSLNSIRQNTSQFF